MRIPIRVTAAVAVAAAAVAIAATPAFATASSPASATAGTGGGHAVFVQTDNTAGNRVVAYRRAADGTLSPAGSYATGGRGGILAGSVVDHTASQGSLTYDPRHGLLYAVNAGSDTISVFAVRGDRLALREVLSSGGTFPVSVAVHGDLVYVLNALNGGSVQGYRVLGSFLAPLPGSHRALGLDPNATPSSPPPPARWPSPRTEPSSSSPPRATATTSTCSASGSAGACPPRRPSTASPAPCRSRSPSTRSATW